MNYMKSNQARELFLEESNIKSILQWWLVTVLMLLPFQSGIEVFFKPFSIEYSKFIGYLDELTILVIFPAALFKLYKNKEYPIRLYSIILFPLVLLVISGFVSGFINGNRLIITAMGVYDYIEIFLVIFIFAAFFNKFDEVNKIFHALIKIALIIVAIALVQEVWALISRYILEMGEYDISNWRLGIYRPRSVMKNPNIFGLYTLLIFIIYLSLSKKVNYFIFVVFLSGIIFSISRVVYTGLIFLCIVHLYRTKTKFILVIIPMLILSLMIFIINIEFQKRTFISKEIGQEISSYDDYRKTTRETAISIWKDRMLLGIGPGMFGGNVSLKHNSKVYREYGYSDDIMWHMRQTGNIDQFWFQLIAEMGLVGVIIYFLFFVALITVLLIVRIWSSSYHIGKLFLGLLIITLTIILFTTYTGLKNTPLMFTYSAIFGMAIGSEKKQYGYYKSIK